MMQRSTTGTAWRVTLALTCAIAWMIGAVDARGQAGADAGARASAVTSNEHVHRIGDATSEWLDLQRTNATAAPALPTPGPQATLAYERYMDSFRTKIPASFGSTLSGERGGLRVDYSNAGGGAAQPSGAN